MEEMDNSENREVKVRKLTPSQKAKKEEQARQKIAFNLDNYTIAVDVSIAILQVEGTSEEVKSKANDVLSATLDKLMNL